MRPKEQAQNLTSELTSEPDEATAATTSRDQGDSAGPEGTVSCVRPTFSALAATLQKGIDNIVTQLQDCLVMITRKDARF